MVNIFNYLDYRSFLRDIYKETKEKNKVFSYRYLAKKSGLRSPSFFTWIIQGKRNLSQELVLKYAGIFKLTKKEAEYFELLVHFNQAQTKEEREHFYKRLLPLTAFSGGKTIKPRMYQFYEKWYHQAVWLCLEYFDFKGDYRKLAGELIPAISPAEAQESVQLLLDLELIHKNAQGRYLPTDKKVTTGSRWNSKLISDYQKKTMDLARNSISRFSKPERDISNVMVSCSQETFEYLREKLQGFRREIMEIVSRDPEPDRIYQWNLQLFPLTKKRKKGKKEQAPGGSRKS